MESGIRHPADKGIPKNCYPHKSIPVPFLSDEISTRLRQGSIRENFPVPCFEVRDLKGSGAGGGGRKQSEQRFATLCYQNGFPFLHPFDQSARLIAKLPEGCCFHVSTYSHSARKLLHEGQAVGRPSSLARRIRWGSRKSCKWA